MCEMWSLENLHICNCDALQELPARIDALTALHALELEYLEIFEKPDTLSFSILELTALIELTFTEYWLTDVSFIESITNLRFLTICVREAGISTLACALPALRLLHYLSIDSLDLDKDKVLIISCSLKAWPLHFLVDIDFSHVMDLLRGAGTAAQPPRGGWLDQHRSPAAMLCTTTQGVGLCEWDGRLGAASPV